MPIQIELNHNIQRKYFNHVLKVTNVHKTFVLFRLKYMTFSETLFIFSRGRRFYEIVGKYYLLKTSTEQIFYSD